MKSFLLPSLAAGVALLVLSFVALYGLVYFFSGLAEEYYNPVFHNDPGRNVLFFIHPFVLSFALAWFWNRFKGVIQGSWLLRSLELGLIYGLVAVLPVMLLTFSAIEVSLPLILSWVGFGALQAVVAGLVFSKMNP